MSSTSVTARHRAQRILSLAMSLLAFIFRSKAAKGARTVRNAHLNQSMLLSSSSSVTLYRTVLWRSFLLVLFCPFFILFNAFRVDVSNECFSLSLALRTNRIIECLTYEHLKFSLRFTSQTM